MLIISNFKTNYLIAISVCIINLCAIRAIGQPNNTVFIPVKPDVLSNSYISCSFKDSKGFMWFGTREGLVRYDGTNVFRYEYNSKDATSIPHNSINIITESPNKDLWIGTASGLCKFDRQKDIVLLIPEKEKILKEEN